MAGILDTIRQAIENSGLSRYAISKATGIDQGHLANLMKSRAGLSIENLEKLVEYLGLEIVIRKKQDSKGA